MQVAMSEVFVLFPPPMPTPVSHPLRPQSRRLRPSRVPARSRTVSWLSSGLSQQIRLGAASAAVSLPVWTGRSVEAWAREARKMLSVEELVCFSKKTHQPLAVRVAAGCEGVCFPIGLHFCEESVKKGGVGALSLKLSPVRCPSGSCAAGLLRRVGHASCVRKKGFARPTSWSSKPWGAKFQVMLSPEANFKGKTHLPFFWVSTHWFSSSSFIKKNKMFNN